MRGWCAQRGMSVHITCRFQIHRQRDLPRTNARANISPWSYSPHTRCAALPSQTPPEALSQTRSNVLKPSHSRLKSAPNPSQLSRDPATKGSTMERNATFFPGSPPRSAPASGPRGAPRPASTKGRKAPHVPRHSADRRLARPRYGASRRPIPGRRRMLRESDAPRCWRVRAQREKMRGTIGRRPL